jgi:hypothetical protein
MGLLGLIASLGGCQQKAATSVVAKENPPPKPPNCPDLPELENLRLKDGSIADVRIFRDGDETFYIPFSWLDFEARRYSDQSIEGNNIYNSFRDGTINKDQYFVKIRESGIKYYWRDRWIGKYIPDVSEIECPGVVHVGQFNYIIPTVPLGTDTIKDVPPNFVAGTHIQHLRFSSYDPEYLPSTKSGSIYDGFIELKATGEEIDQNVGSATALLRMGTRHIATYDGFPYDEIINAQWAQHKGDWAAYKTRALASEKWHVWRDSVKDVFVWLTTPPKDRDNNRKFKLGDKGQ